MANVFYHDLFYKWLFLSIHQCKCGYTMKNNLKWSNSVCSILLTSILVMQSVAGSRMKCVNDCLCNDSIIRNWNDWNEAQYWNDDHSLSHWLTDLWRDTVGWSVSNCLVETSRYSNDVADLILIWRIFLSLWLASSVEKLSVSVFEEINISYSASII
jgi:hypothetical protein